jgi:hypothetical protein
MNNKTYTNLKEKLENGLSDLTNVALQEKDENKLDTHLKKISQINGKLSTLKSLFGKINLDKEGNPVLKDSDGSIQWKF